MLCPEVSNFPPPKVMTYSKECEDFDLVEKTIKMNNFYKSVIVTCPDEIQIPNMVQEKLLEDTEYYKLTGCSINEFVVPTFIESFVKNGRFYCLSTNRNCIVENCVAVNPEGCLTLHLLEFVYQTLGLEGTKRNHRFYEVKLDLKNLHHVDKLKWSLGKLELFDFHIFWEPNNENVCPSSIAKYFDDRGINISVCSLETKRISPSIEKVPVLKDVDVDEMHEWVGMLAHEVSMEPKETYISTYGQPDSENALETNRIAILIVKGFFTPNIIEAVCRSLTEYAHTRHMDHYWVSCSFQSCDDSPWQWNPSSPMTFQSHDSSCNVFITNTGYKIYSIGQLKYS